MSHKILTIDDSTIVRKIIIKTFQIYACEVFEASNGPEGLAMVESIHPDLIFLDYSMPELSGIEVLEKIRDIPSLRETPVIMLTATSSVESIERADRLKVKGYISKPFRIDHLVEIASGILKLERLTPPQP